MKIRINGNSLRLRLAQAEISQLVKLGEVSTECKIGNNHLTYRIISKNVPQIYAQFEDQTISVYIPKKMINHWDIDERVGFDHSADDLYILIEKDFQCLKPRPNEDESDLFPNPQSTISSYD